MKWKNGGTRNDGTRLYSAAIFGHCALVFQDAALKPSVWTLEVDGTSTEIVYAHAADAMVAASDRLLAAVKADAS